jgi:hypothetical protein
MRSRWLVAFVVVLLAGSAGAVLAPEAGAAPVPGPAPASPPSVRHPIGRVLIFSLPGVGWRDVVSHRTPHLRRLLDRAAIADLSTRAPKLRNGLADNYASLSAGDKAVGASATPDAGGLAPAGAAYRVDELLGTTRAGAVFTRRTGRDAGAGLVVLGVEQLVVANAATPFRATVGAFGGALGRAGWSRSVLANGDGLDVGDAATVPRRAAATALMDEGGTVPSGDVTSRLLMADPAAPFGRRLDPGAVEGAFTSAWRPRSVVLVEGSDLVRVHEYRGVVDAARAKVLRTDALRSTDALVGRLLTHVDLTRDAVVVVGTAPDSADGRLAAVAVRAPGVAAGLLRSGTTQRTGFVQLMDVAPSVLDLLGIEAPTTMRGRPVAVGDASGSAHARQHFLVDADTAAAFREKIQEAVAHLFLVMVVVLLALALVALARPRSGWAVGASWWSAVTLAFLPAAYLARVVPFHQIGAAAYWGWIALVSVALAAAARAVGTRHPGDPTIALLGLTTAVLGIDVVLGSPLQFNGALGFSPEVAGRFIGFGNAGFAVFGASALFLACLVAARGGRGARVIAVGILVAAVALDGAPVWGADVGGALTLVPAFGLVTMRLLGRRVRLRSVALAAAATAVAVGGAIAFDLSRPPGSRTHLGRLVEQMQREGPGELVAVVTRKLGMNLASFGSSPFRWLLPVTIIGGLALWWFPGRAVPAAWRRLDPTGALTVGFAALVGLGYALNDTGVLVPALMGAVALAAVVPVAVRAPAATGYRRDPSGEVPCRT